MIIHVTFYILNLAFVLHGYTNRKINEIKGNGISLIIVYKPDVSNVVCKMSAILSRPQ